MENIPRRVPPARLGALGRGGPRNVPPPSFRRPILYQVWTYGLIGRAFLKTLSGSDLARFKWMAGRFVKSGQPGATDSPCR